MANSSLHEVEHFRNENQNLLRRIEDLKATVLKITKSEFESLTW